MHSSCTSAVSESSTLVDVPGVTFAVQHLQELGSRMRAEEFGFIEEDVSVIDDIVESIQDLADECKKVHEKLETETINSSVVRHRLQFLPGLISREIAAAIASARLSNANELERLQKELKRITESIKKVTARHKELEASNSLLHPERDAVRQKHEDIIAQLNLRMAEKASKQIALNETRDRVRETNQKIVDLEEGIIQLKEDLIQERADARMEKKRLKKAVYDTTVKTREQKEINIEKREEVDGLHSRVLDLEGQLSDFRKTIRQMETSRSKLEGVERALTAQYARQVNTNQDLRIKGLEIAKQIEDQDGLFAEEKQKLEDVIKELNEDLEYEKKKAETNSVLRLSLQATVKEKLKVRQLDEKKVSAQNKVLQKSKGELAVKAEELAKLRQENQDMEERIIELNETHEALEAAIEGTPPTSGVKRAIMQTLSKQIQECKDALAKERKERVALQENRDDGQKQLDEIKIETTKAINVLTRKCNDGKIQHDELQKDKQGLKRQITQYREELQNLEEAVRKAGEQLTDVKQDQIDVVQKVQDKMMQEITEMRKQTEEMTTTIEERTPPFTQLEQDFEEMKVNYDTTMKQVVGEYVAMMLMWLLPQQTTTIEERTPPFTQLEQDFEEMKVNYDTTMKQVVGEYVAMMLMWLLPQQTTTIEERTPPFTQLEQDFEEMKVNYDSTMKQVVVVKNQKIGLDESVKRTKRDMDKLVNPRQQLRYSVKARREDTLKTLRKQNAEVKDIEQQIYDVGTKLRTAMEENQRFKEANSKLRSDIAKLHSDMKTNKQKKDKLDKNFVDLREELEHGWGEDRSLEQQFCERDEKVVTELADLLNTAERREEVISDITVKLQDELSVLADFLENVAKRRPKDSGGKKTKSALKTTTTIKEEPEVVPNRPEAPTREVTFYDPATHKTGNASSRTGTPGNATILEAVEQVAEANRTTPTLLSARRTPLPAIKPNK